MKYRFAIRSNELFSPSFTLSRSSSGVFLTLRDPLLNEKRSIHFENEIKDDKRHLYRGHHGTSPKKRRYEIVRNENGGRLVPECSYLVGHFSLCATEDEFHRRKNSKKVDVFDYDLGKNDIVSIHLVSAPKEHDPDCPPSFAIVKEIAEGATKWMLILEEKAVDSVYDMVRRSVDANGFNAVWHGAESKGRFEHTVLVTDLHEGYRPQKGAQMTLVIANRNFEVYVDPESGQPKMRGYIVRK